MIENWTVGEARKVIQQCVEMALWDAEHMGALTMSTIRNMQQAVDAFEDAVRAEARAEGIQEERERQKERNRG